MSGGLELVRQQAEQDKQIDLRVKKTGDTMAGTLNFSPGNGSKISHDGKSILHRYNNQTILGTEAGGNIIFRPNGVDDSTKQVVIGANGDVAMDGTLYLQKTTDLSGIADNRPALIIGGTATGEHLEFDGNEIHAKGNGTTPANLHINADGGVVQLGKNTLHVADTGLATVNQQDSTGGIRSMNGTKLVRLHVQNDEYAWVSTDTTKGLYVNQNLSVKGEIYAGSTYNKRVYHEGNKPTATDVGAIAKTDYEVGTNGLLKDISNQDVRTINKSGRYKGNNCTNAPTSNTWYFYDIEVHSPVYKRITARHFFSNKEYTAFCNNNVWSAWETPMLTYHPVGSIYMSTSNTNPSAIMGGTWEAWGSGRVPVGVNTGDTDFNTSNKTGGSKTQTLRAAIGAVNGNIGWIGYNAQDPITGIRYSNNLGAKGTDHTGTVTASNHSTAVLQPNGATPTTVQPYVTCYMWRRTA